MMKSTSLIKFSVLATTFLSATAFHNQLLSAQTASSTKQWMSNDDESSGRRAFLSGIASAGLLPQLANAGIDVSGLRSDGIGNPALKEQLKAFDGSASSRVNQIKELAPSTTPTASPVVTGAPVEEDGPIATWLYRASPAFNPRLSRAGALGNLYKYEDKVVAPSSTKAGSFSLCFEFPADWLQLDKFLGGVSYVDQRNGDRLYLLRTKLPEGERLATVPKSFMGTSVFDPKGTIVKSGGIEVDDYTVSSAVMLSDCPDNTCATHRRFKIKYSTVTGNGLRVERRALVDAYEMTPEGDLYMLMTSSNAIKFDAKGSRERETVEGIVDSFRIDV